jgi:diguanylate cyclase (GGDEF)-like protein
MIDRRQQDLLEERDRDITRRVNRRAPLLSGGVFVMSASLWPLFGLRAVFVFALFSFAFQALDPAFPPVARWAAARPGIVMSAGAISVGCVLTGGLRSPLVALFAFPTVVACAHLRARRLAVTLATVVVCIVVVGATTGAAPVLANLAVLVVALVTVMLVGIVVMALAASDFEHRAAALLDPLTGMLSRHGLAVRFAELSAQAARTSAPLSLVLVDIDEFKSVNDDHGHGRGDAVLEAVAAILTAGLRSFDLAYRLGGDEFAVILPGVRSAEAAELAERLRRAVEHAQPGGLPITLSIGVSTASGEGLLYRALYAVADAALYRAKVAGRNRVESSGDELGVPALAA